MYEKLGWFIENYEKDNLQLKADQLKISSPVFIENCVGTSITI